MRKELAPYLHKRVPFTGNLCQIIQNRDTGFARLFFKPIVLNNVITQDHLWLKVTPTILNRITDNIRLNKVSDIHNQTFSISTFLNNDTYLTKCKIMGTVEIVSYLRKSNNYYRIDYGIDNPKKIEVLTNDSNLSCSRKKATICSTTR